MPGDPSQDQDFLQAHPGDQHAYLMQTDPDYAKAPPQDQTAYLNHIWSTNLPKAPTLPVEQQHGILNPRDPVQQAQDKVYGTSQEGQLNAAPLPIVPSVARAGLGTLVRGAVRGAAGAYAGSEVGNRFGPTGRVVGGLLGGLAMGSGKIRVPNWGGIGDMVNEPIPPPELGTPENPGFVAKLPTRMPAAKEPEVTPISEGPTGPQHEAVRAGQQSALREFHRTKVPLSESPVPAPEPEEPIGNKIVTGEEGIKKTPAPKGQEGRPATWTNERVIELAKKGNRDAIDQVDLRKLPMPENVRYVKGAEDFPKGHYNPKFVKKFTRITEK